jgi:hypothetical protein
MVKSQPRNRKESAQESDSQKRRQKRRRVLKRKPLTASFKARLPNLGRASSGVKNPMTGQRTPVRRAVGGGINSEPAEMDNVAEAIDRVSREVQAARRDVGMTSFCLQQAEALRRIDRAKASIADLVRSRNRENKHS